MNQNMYDTVTAIDVQVSTEDKRKTFVRDKLRGEGNYVVGRETEERI